jgi:Putative  PD-(D/E)XK family member, (DUF4420)
MSQMPDLAAIITGLRNSAGGGTIIRRRVDPASPVDVYVGIEPLTGHIGVLLRLHRRLVPPEKDHPGGAGFAIQIHTIAEDVKDIVNLGIFCTDQASEDVFLHFMNDIVARLLMEEGPEPAVRAFMARVSLWQRFFLQGRDVHLSEDAQAGLLGELLTLRDLVIPAAGAGTAVAAWTGPEGKPQDFLLAGGALEVKCTRAKAGGRIAVASELQLDERPFVFLIVVHVSLSPAGEGHSSLPDMVAAVRALLTGPAILAFDDKLITAGYLNAHAAHYRECRFLIREVSFFQVRDAFPRIRAGEFRAGVVEIAYKIDLTGITPYKIERPAVEAMIQV